MQTSKSALLKQLGVITWSLRQKESLPIVAPWQTLRQAVRDCTACPLHQTRTQTVFGVGSLKADLLLVGEAPGFHEDQQGEPFVGRAGQLLNQMLATIGLNRETVYIANILKCRPPQNRDPSREEAACCLRFLKQQIALIAPKVILALGRIAAHTLLDTNVSLESLRQKEFHYGEHAIPLLVTYHPAYLLRNPIDKKKAYIDWCRLKPFV